MYSSQSYRELNGQSCPLICTCLYAHITDTRTCVCTHNEVFNKNSTLKHTHVPVFTVCVMSSVSHSRTVTKTDGKKYLCSPHGYCSEFAITFHRNRGFKARVLLCRSSCLKSSVFTALCQAAPMTCELKWKTYLHTHTHFLHPNHRHWPSCHTCVTHLSSSRVTANAWVQRQPQTPCQCWSSQPPLLTILPWIV